MIQAYVLDVLIKTLPSLLPMPSMVYMSRMPVDGNDGQSRLGKRIGDGPKRSAGTDKSADTDQGLEAEREFQNFTDQT